jgi:membrane-bound metal-dependent hydrolase YbcI (DUF457 family)
MFIGHFGLGLGAKKFDRRPSLGTYFMAAQFLDLIWPLFLLFGWEKAEPIPNGPPLENLDFVSYPYSHSLFFALIWSLLFGIIYYMIKKQKRAAIFLGFLVLSHWILDFFTHTPDLPLTPWSNYKVGLGLWNYPILTVIIEGAIFIAGILLFLKNVQLKNREMYISLLVMLLFLVSTYISSFFSPPPKSTNTLAWLALIQWLFVIWGYFIDRSKNDSKVRQS